MRLSHQPSTPAPVSLRTTRRSREEGGYVLTTFALLLVPLLLMVGLSVDVGYWYNRAAAMQKAADAAALAGVVWLPDENAASTAALAAAARNGFSNSGTVTVTVTRSTKSDRRLKVTIQDTKVGSFFYQSLTGKKIPLQRTAYAEYILAVPMGSPRNFMGTGTLLADYTATGITPEYLYESVNPYCTDKANGDRYQSMSDGDTCGGTANDEYRSSGYTSVVLAPENRTSPIEVRLYDGRYNDSDISWQVQSGTTCVDTPAYLPADPDWTGPGSNSTNITITGPGQYQTRSSTTGSWSTTNTLGPLSTLTRATNLLRYRLGTLTWSPSTTTWFGPGTTSTSRTLRGPAQYQTRSSTTGSWGSTQTLSSGNTFSRADNLLRYRTATIDTTPVCSPAYTTITDSAVDSKRQSGDESFTYTVYSADNTPLNDTDNPVLCQKTFTKDTAFDDYEYLGSRRWNTLCTIPTNAMPGRYLVRATNSGAVMSPEADGSNQYGLVAKYTNAAGDGLCDGRTDAMCPRVFGNDAISVKAASVASVASFYLAEIDPIHAGKKMRLELFDPGEGGSTIQIMKPTGTDGNTWTPATFSWTSDATCGGCTSGTNVTSLDVTSNRFNDKLVTITIDLSGYTPPSNNDWWQIKYTFSGTVTDRTTWSARIIGDPVHLVEEY